MGGVLYISYNTLPGWTAFAPLRHPMTEHAELICAEGRGIVNRIDGAIDFIDKLIATNPAYFRANAQIAERFELIEEQNRHDLAHEHFNRCGPATRTTWRRAPVSTRMIAPAEAALRTGLTAPVAPGPNVSASAARAVSRHAGERRC